ncbi:MAG: hypothetical protein CL693_20000 [Cellvibrionaceae bacterium]|nr:hypothetical protein [Cellvibrionaceae bacterium]
MLSSTQVRLSQTLAILVASHIVIIAASNYLVQLPFQLWGFHTTWGAFSFPLVYLATDLTVRIYGAEMARRIVFFAMLPALLLSYVISVLWLQGVFVGFEGFSQLNTFVARIALASFTAYLLGQLMDIRVFDYFRREARWWVAPACSTIIGNMVDTAVFFSVAFYASSDPFMAEHWVEIAVVDFGFKVVVSLLLFLPIYRLLLNRLSEKLKSRI